jgi:dTDP-4-amino-4,6-dideoxygalactose transaminase
MDPILEVAREHGLKVIEDTAQGHGARYKGRRVGSLGDAGTFSFYPGKNLGAYGDGGAIVFSDADVAARARLYANHGSTVKYHHEIEGRNSRLDGVQAAVLRVKLRYLDQWNQMRRDNAALYSELLAPVEGVQTPAVAEWAEPVFHLYVVRVADRERLMQRLGEHGVATGIHYPVPLPMLEAYKHLGHTPEDFPVATAQTANLVSLPMYPELTDEMIRYAADAIAREVSLEVAG